MPAEVVLDRLPVVEQSLSHRSPQVRMAAAAALGRARAGVPALRARLATETRGFVVAEICDSLAASGRGEVTPDLERLAIEHRSELARSYAAMAIADLQGRSAIAFLRERLAAERSRRGKATLATLLLSLGMDDHLDYVVRALSWKDYFVRSRVTNLLTQYLRELPPQLEAVLRRLAADDPTVAVRSSAAKALADMGT